MVLLNWTVDYDRKRQNGGSSEKGGTHSSVVNVSSQTSEAREVAPVAWQHGRVTGSGPGRDMRVVTPE